MRNLVVLRDQSHRLIWGHDATPMIVAVTFDRNLSRAYLLLHTGLVMCLSEIDDVFAVLSTCSLCEDLEQQCSDWFQLDFIAGTGSVVAISHSGSIVSIETSESNRLTPEEIGCIEGGIASAMWSPDQSSLTIVTNNNTVLCMSSTWDVLQEIPAPARVPGSAVDLSWRGDGEGLAIVTTDSEDNTSRVRIYNKQLEVVAVGRNVADGPSSVMKGIGGVVSFASNGSYIAVCQEQKTAGGSKLQVALVERNGLRHGDFDLQLPPVPAGWDRWQESTLDWDLPTTLLAIGLRAVRTDKSSGQADREAPGLVQLYYRGNYHWYLKQQWQGAGLRFLGFDQEQVNRLYFSQVLHDTAAAAAEQGTGRPVLRVVDLTWDVCSSDTSDGSVAVVDGAKLLLTPLGINNIPPPMCKSTVSVAGGAALTASGPHCARASCFWSPPSGTSNNNAAWGLAALDANGYSVLVVYGDATGAVLSQQLLDVGTSLPEVGDISYRGMAVTESAECVRIVLLGSPCSILPLDASMYGGSNSASDVLVVVTCVRAEGSLWVQPGAVMVGLPDGAATRVFPVPRCADSVGVGIERSGSSGAEFEVYRVALTASAADEDGQPSCQLVATLPERCTHLSFIADKANPSAVQVVALSLRNRLYCGESLLSVGVSSAVYNESFGVLMFATLGTRPHLHFCSIQRLQALDALQHSEDQESAECAEPRPIERGARLVVSAEGSSKVVMQLPRGNLETIEPRPLILLRAQQLIHDRALLDCLVLLRKQRVDLNYLVDYSPRIFLDSAAPFVTSMLRTNHDLISLLVTALEPADCTAFKYPLDRSCRALQEPREVPGFVGQEKVNRVCTVVRNVLLPLLLAARQAVPADDVASSRILQPVLCTLAKQQPARLEEALDLIKLCCTAGGVMTSTTVGAGEDVVVALQVVGGTANLSSVMAQVSIKYLAFLVEGSQLFDAALGTCDFDMARAVARQCQMDPKAYLPLVEGFEAVARGFPSSSPQTALMRYRVSQHLKRYEAALGWAAQLLRRAQNSAEASLQEAVTSVVAEVRATVKSDGLHTYVLPRVAALEAELQLDPAQVISAGAAGYDLLICMLLSDLRLEYGQLCASRMEYTEALAALLATQPVRAAEAIDVAKQMGNWQLAISIAGRFQNEESYKGMSELSPVFVAQQIVSEFRENLEQGEACGQLQGTMETATGAGVEGVETVATEDKVAEAARLCVDFCGDHEGAIAILTTAERWLPALQLAMRFNRRDLHSEIASAARGAARELMAALPKRALKVLALVEELAALWADPAERLKNVASTDVTLMDELNGVDAAQQRQADDNMSEYSAVTQQSTLSRSSARSSGSRYSTKSGSSVVSVLSNLSAASGLSGTAGGADKASAFAIEGLEHTLLSRGTVTAHSEGAGEGGAAGRDGKRSKKQYKRDQTERRQKRIERSKAKGASKDIWGLRREGAVCDELLGYARQLRAVCRSCRDLCEALQLIAEKGDMALAVALQQACDEYMRFVQQHPPCVAPNYPPDWLVKRALAGVRHFQDPHSLALAAAQLAQTQAGFGEQASLGGEATGNLAKQDAAKVVGAVTSWWDIAAAGLKEWYATSRITLTLHKA